MTKSKLLTVAEIASYWRCKAETVLSEIKSGALPATNIRPGSRRPTWRVASADLADFMQRNQVAPKSVQRVCRDKAPAADFFPEESWR